MKGCIIENGTVTNILEFESVEDMGAFGAVDLGKYAEIGHAVVDGVCQEATDAENTLKESSMRDERNRLLSETDRYGLSDMTMTSEMSAYRQALRDLPQQAGVPDVELPVKP